MNRKLLIASGNRNKIYEINKLLAGLGLEIVGMGEYPDLPEVEEDGETFKDNALKKARERSIQTGLLTMADDSGIEVDHLKGRPGVYSARYAGLTATDDENNRKLIEELKGVRFEERTARYRAVIALVDPLSGKEYTVEGSCKGIIAEHPRGNNGFGYDPYFWLPAYNKTMAELTLEEKNKISHRAEALNGIKEILENKYSIGKTIKL
ncbi:MAG: XTP/dITP diphosphatase [Firmicutes bacterium]|nr:XTP/dITP diphosphatase [Bacillota bacterium]